MKYLLLFFVFTLLQGKFAAEDTTIYEGSAWTEEPTTAPTCPEGCLNSGTCTPKGTCECTLEYFGDRCEYREGECVEELAKAPNSVCSGNETNDITVVYSKSVVGAFSVTNATCTTCDGKVTPLARRKCEQLEGESKYALGEATFANCSVSIDDQSVEQQADFYVTATSNTNMSSETINDAVAVMNNVTSADNVAPDMADDMATLTNNLLLADDSDAVSNNSASILNSIDEMTLKVELTPTSDGNAEYKTEESNLAIAVVGEDSPTSRIIRDFAGNYYYGPAGEWDVRQNLARSNMTLSRDSNNFKGSYMQATASSVDRIRFKVYSAADNLFPPLTKDISNKIVFSVNGSTEFSLKFQILGDFPLFSGDVFNKFREGDKVTYQKIACSKYNESSSSWDMDAGCTPDGGNGSYATCNCTQPGSYAMRTLDVDVVIIDEGGLTGGEIAGIVVGSVVGVALIVGAIYYFAVYRKAKKATKVKPAEENIPMEEGGHESDNDSTMGHRNDAASVHDD